MFDVPQPKIKANYYNFKIMLQFSRFISMQAKVNNIIIVGAAFF